MTTTPPGAALKASADRPDAPLFLAPTEGTEAAHAAVDDAIAALGLPRTAARLRLEGPSGEVAHAAVVSVGTHGNAIVAEVANAPWHESPTLAAFGCAVKRERGAAESARPPSAATAENRASATVQACLELDRHHKRRRLRLS